MLLGSHRKLLFLSFYVHRLVLISFFIIINMPLLDRESREMLGNNEGRELQQESPAKLEPGTLWLMVGVVIPNPHIFLGAHLLHR